MSYDLNILCVSQKKPVLSLPKDINIYVESQNQQSDSEPKFYGEYCPYMNAVNGIWYYLQSKKDEISSFELCDIFFNDEEVKDLYPFWYKKGDEIDVSILHFRREYEEDILKTIKFFIEQSPKHIIYFHSRYQTFEDEPEFIYGVIPYHRFIELLKNNKILFNTAYIINE